MNVALRPKSLDILSICTGGGGLDLGIELAVPGARSVCMVEREAFAVAHLVSAMEQGLLAPAPVWSDAGTFDGRAWRGAVDGLIGGIPCQPHSLAGRKQGSLDHRDLWSDARRIIVQSRCWFVLIENVGGMLSAGADEVAGAERVWRDLRKLGFAVEIGLFSAAEVGASHQRERVFILAVADDAFGRRGSAAVARGCDGPEGAAGGCRLNVADPGSQGLQGRRSSGSGQGERAPVERGCRDVDNAFGGRRPARRDDHRRDVGNESTAAGELALVDAEVIGRGEGRAEPILRGRRDTSASAGEPMGHTDLPVVRRQSPTGQLTQLQSQHGYGAGPLFPPGPCDSENWKAVLERAPELEPAIRRVADGLASRLDVGRVDRLRMLGNGVVPLQAAHAIRTLCHRLAGRSSAGAARLVRMMEVVE